MLLFFLRQQASLDEDECHGGADGPAVGGAESADLAFAEPGVVGVGGNAVAGGVGEQIDGEHFLGAGGLFAGAAGVGDVFEALFRPWRDAEIDARDEVQLLGDLAAQQSREDSSWCLCPPTRFRARQTLFQLVSHSTPPPGPRRRMRAKALMEMRMETPTGHEPGTAWRYIFSINTSVISVMTAGELLGFVVFLAVSEPPKSNEQRTRADQ